MSLRALFARLHACLTAADRSGERGSVRAHAEVAGLPRGERVVQVAAHERGRALRRSICDRGGVPSALR